MPLFDAYVMVDWSASSKPKRGADSIWACVMQRREGMLARMTLINLRTRHAAMRWLVDTLSALRGEGARVLVGFDFPLGYPAGFAARLDVNDAAWQAVWNEIAQMIVDDAENANNRFVVAGRINRRLGGLRFPFWGHHAAHRFPDLGRHRPEGYGPRSLTEHRMSDGRIKGPQPVWKLYGNGSVGSQALLGIPVVRALRERFDGAAQVWPFETGLTEPGRDAAIVLAEIYPSLVRVERGGVKDARQVEAIGRHFARHDDGGTLATLLRGGDLPREERRVVEREEGWILGVT